MKKAQLKLSTPYHGGALNIGFDLPKDTLTIEEATDLSVIIEAFILDSLHKKPKYKAIFGKKPINQYYVHFDKEVSCDKACNHQEEPIQNLGL